MSHDRNISPVGWYVGTYQIRFVELADPGNDDPERRFRVWENTVLVKAADLDEAYEKVVAIGRGQTTPYQAGPDAIDSQWLFEGVIALLPIYEELSDGAEILWAERNRKLRNIRRTARAKREFHQ